MFAVEMAIKNAQELILARCVSMYLERTIGPLIIVERVVPGRSRM